MEIGFALAVTLGGIGSAGAPPTDPPVDPPGSVSPAALALRIAPDAALVLASARHRAA